MANGAIAYHYESQLETAYVILEYRRFAGADINKYIPFIENAVVFFDERFTTRHAEELLQQANLTKKKRKRRLDMLAAQLLLSAYLESSRRADDPGSLDN